MAPFFLRKLEYSHWLIFLIWDNLYSLPFDDGSSLFALFQNFIGILELHCFVSAGPIVVDVSHLEGLISTSVYHLENLQHYLEAFQQNPSCRTLYLSENIQKTEVFIQISIPKNSNRGELRSCEDIIFLAWPDAWQQNHTMERKFLWKWLLKLTRLLLIT